MAATRSNGVTLATIWLFIYTLQRHHTCRIHIQTEWNIQHCASRSLLGHNCKCNGFLFVVWRESLQWDSCFNWIIWACPLLQKQTFCTNAFSVQHRNMMWLFHKHFTETWTSQLWGCLFFHMCHQHIIPRSVEKSNRCNLGDYRAFLCAECCNYGAEKLSQWCRSCEVYSTPNLHRCC